MRGIIYDVAGTVDISTDADDYGSDNDCPDYDVDVDDDGDGLQLHPINGYSSETHTHPPTPTAIGTQSPPTTHFKV